MKNDYFNIFQTKNLSVVADEDVKIGQKIKVEITKEPIIKKHPATITKYKPVERKY